jgi:sulfate adenylyltransferase subunit 1
MNILRITTAGSVDDGKSTLIGRLLYETKSISQDKLEALESASKRKGLDFTDLSLLTDGLVAEREQGITIDVAHIYFASPTRKYIIADTPGHVEYTRNMVTGASNAKVSLILVDARQGVLEQTYRHFFIATLLRIPHVIVCVNKMDLVGYDQQRFDDIVEKFGEITKKLSFQGQTLQFVPISSLYGENITSSSEKMNWYKGKALLQTLEEVEVEASVASLPARFSVQYVIRPHTTEFHDYRGYAGKIASGTLAIGDEITVLPTGQTSHIQSIEKFGVVQQTAHAGESVVVTLTTDVDVSRGNMLAKTGQEPAQRKELTANVCWMDSQALQVGRTYLLQHGVNRAKAKISSLNHGFNVQTLEVVPEQTQLKMNEIGQVQIRLAQPIFADSYSENPTNGAFILIDEYSHSTVGVGFVE